MSETSSKSSEAASWRLHRTAPVLVAGLLSLAACEATVTGNADNSTAENSCVTAVNTNSGSRGAMVMASETSATGTRVLVLSGGGQTWTCNATSAGVVEGLTVN